MRDKTQPAYPWNFFDVVNQTATAEGFIANLTNKCTYLPIEDVLPLHSLLYEEYLMLNELNRVRVKGNLIRDVQLKQRMLDELFAKNKSVSYKVFAKWLRQNSPYTDVTENDISGTQEPGKFTASLRTRYDLEKHGFTVNDQTMEQLETLVRWSTIFEDRSILKKLIQEQYPEVTDNQLSFLVQRRYTGWGRLSKKLLTGVLGEYENQPATIMEVLRATNENFMQVLNNPQYHFQEEIAKERLMELGEPKEKIDYDEIRKLQVSPALKRGIWTAVRIVKELIEHQHGCHPHAIYLENTREETPDEKKQRTQSRLNQVEQMYKELAEDKTAEKVPSECWNVLKNCRDKKKLDDQQYLYLLQLGKSLYSGKPLDFDQLSTTTEIDHILPRCYIVDNSIENRALVLKGENQRKGDSLLLEDSIRDSQRPWWNYLRQKGLMGEKKFKNLTRSVVSDEDKQKFAARQLVETGQMVQCVTELFKRYYPDVHVRGIKAGLSSELREQYGLYKIRELNDMHHAYDAFLAATMGNFVERFMPWLDNESSAAIRVRKAQKANKGDDNKVDLSSKHGMILAKFSRDQVDADTGEIIRNAQQEICYLKAVWGYHDGHVVFLKRQKSGKITEDSRYRAGNKSAKMPLKKGLPCQRYGGFDSINPAYIAAISYQKGKQRAGALVNVPIYLAEAIEKNPNALLDYLEKDYPGVQIIRSKILIRQKIEYEGNELTLGSCTETYNAKELFLPTFLHPILAKIYNASCVLTDADENQLNTLIDVLLEKLSSQYPIYSGALKALEAKKSEILSLSIADKGKFIAETMKITSAGKEYAKYSTALPKLGIADKGRLNNKLPHPEKIILIDQSITGLREKRTKLWPDSEPS